MVFFAVLLLAPAAGIQLALDVSAPAALCQQRIFQIRESLTAYNRAAGRFPDSLSDLVPKFLPDQSSLRCPADRSRAAEPGFNGHADPRGGVSYSYEISGAPSGGMAIPPGPPPPSDLPGRPWGTERNVRLWLRHFYGDRPPIVRCLHHSNREGPIALNLTLDGTIYEGTTEWEHDPETIAEFARLAAAELTTDRSAFAKNWRLSGISAAVEGWSLGGSEPAIASIKSLAIALLRNADALNDAADANRVAARLLLHCRDFESAERAARALLALPGHAEEEVARQLLAESLAGRGLFREAAAVYRLMLKKNPDSKNIKANLADALEASGQLDEARTLVAAIDPGRALIGHGAPEFHAPLLSGQETSIATALRGKKALLINFWFLRCGPCRAEHPKLQQLYDGLKDKGLEVLAVNSDDGREPIARYMATSGWTFPVALGAKERAAQSVPGLYFVQLFPTNYIVDRSGKVVYRQAGWDEAGLRRVLESLGVK
jgi:thiol-disulfide isomerase/thioredoxin